MDDETIGEAHQLATESRLLEARARRVLLQEILAQAGQVVGSKEIRDLTEALAWVTNPAQHHG